MSIGHAQIKVFSTGTRYRVLIFKFGWTGTGYRIPKNSVERDPDSVFWNLDSVQSEPDRNLYSNRIFSRIQNFQAYNIFLFQDLSLKNSNVEKGKSLVKFDLKPNFFCGLVEEGPQFRPNF